MARDLDSARRGDLRAFDRLAAAQHERIFTFSYRALGDAQAAADAVLAGLAQAARNLRRLGNGPLDVWLLSWVVKECLLRLREGIAGRDPAHEPDLQDCLCELPGDLRLALLLVDVSGLDYAAAADVLGVSREQVRQRVAQARWQLLDKG